MGKRQVILRARLCRDVCAHVLDQRRIECRSHADGLWKHGRNSVARHPVQRLVPVVVGRHLEARDRAGVVIELGEFLLQRHAADQVRHTLRNRIRGGTCAASGQQDCQQNHAAAHGRR